MAASFRLPPSGGNPEDAKLVEAEKVIQQTWDLLEDLRLAELMNERDGLAKEEWMSGEEMLSEAEKAWHAQT